MQRGLHLSLILSPFQHPMMSTLTQQFLTTPSIVIPLRKQAKNEKKRQHTNSQEVCVNAADINKEVPPPPPRHIAAIRSIQFPSRWPDRLARLTGHPGERAGLAASQPHSPKQTIRGEE